VTEGKHSTWIKTIVGQTGGVPEHCNATTNTENFKKNSKKKATRIWGQARGKHEKENRRKQKRPRKTPLKKCSRGEN